MPQTTQTPTLKGPRGGIRWGSLVKAMEVKGFDPAALALALSRPGDEVSARTIDAWIRGQREPTLAGFDRLASILEIEPAQLLADRPLRSDKKFPVDSITYA